MASERKVAVKKELYKTELCRHYVVGRRCPYRNKCQFAHGSNELVDIARHPKYKTQPCKSYHSTGICTYGPRCHFVHDYTDDSARNSLTGGEVTRTGAGGVQDTAQSEEHQGEDQRKSNGRSNAAATKVTSLVSSSSPGDDGKLEVYRGGVSHEWYRRFQGWRRTWRQKKQDSSEEDSKEEERSREAQRQSADNYLVQKSSGQSEDDGFSVDDRWVKDENEELMTKISHLFPLFSVKESADDKFESSSFYRNSFYRFNFSGTRQKNENPSAARPADGSANLQKTMSKYPNSVMSSDESYGESPDLFNFQTSHQYVSRNFGGKLWTQRQKQPENARPILDLNDSVDQDAKDLCSSLPPVTANVFRRCLCSSQSSSVSRELVYDNGKINGEDFSTDLRRILEEQMFALQSSLLMDTLNQNLQQSTCG